MSRGKDVLGNATPFNMRRPRYHTKDRAWGETTLGLR